MKAITGNRLNDGRVVYLAADGGFVEDIAGARLLDDAEADAALSEHAARVGEVADLYLIDADADGAPAGRAALRERIRASGGPTVDYPAEASR